LRIVMVMYMREPSSEQELRTRLILSPQISVVLACAVAGVVLLGIFPGPLVSVADLSTLPIK
jgi:NADH-quinone oxidoreductase subunit N